MAYKNPDLSVLAYANNFTLWHYTTTDLLSTLEEGNYFGGASKDDLLRTNDLIICNVDTDGQANTHFLKVMSVDGENVRIARM